MRITLCFCVGLCISLVSAGLGNLDKLFVILIAGAPLIMAIDARKIKRAATKHKIFSFFLKHCRVISSLAFLAWIAILLMPILQLSPELISAAENMGIALPWYRRISWWNTWWVPPTYILLWLLAWIMIALNPVKTPHIDKEIHYPHH